MAYFSNGTEGAVYWETYCFTCVNWRPLKEDGKEVEGSEGCPIQDAHMAFQKPEDNHPAQEVLNALIPYGATGNGECKMFQPRKTNNIAITVPSTQQNFWEPSNG